MTHNGRGRIRLEGGAMFSGTFKLHDNGWVSVVDANDRTQVGRVYSPERVRYIAFNGEVYV